MAKTYYTDDFLLIPASKPYPEKTFYKVSTGQQKFGNRFYDVVKIEMVYNGELARGGKITPAFPYESDDLKQIIKELARLTNLIVVDSITTDQVHSSNN